MNIKLVIIFLCYSIISCGKCPSQEVVYPCICQNDTIICGGYNAYDFNQIFSDISRHLNDSKKKFQTFIFNNTEITEIPENSFQDIEFTKIVIKDATNLAKIHSRAFNVNFTANTIKEVEQIGSSKLQNKAPDYDLFKSLSSLINIEKITLTSNLITDLPKNAFGKLQHLTSVNFSTNSITTIGNNAFYNVDVLR